MSSRQPLAQQGGDDVVQGGELAWSFGGGENQSRTWKGTYDALYAEYQTQKTVTGLTPTWDTLTLSWMNGKATLVANAVASSSAIGEMQPSDGATYYELLRNEFRSPIWTHPYFSITSVADGTALTAAEIAAVKLAWDDGTVLTVGGSVTAKMVKLQAYMLTGVPDVPMTGWILRESKQVALRSNKNIVSSGINTVQSPPDTSAANKLIGQVPTGGEWLYKGGDVSGSKRGRWKITSEWWWWYQWPAILGGSFDPS
jgi:hypothetical protein